ncbi:hypothetical protein AB0K08_16835 [Citricoccus sp. NPDC055426]|uniref:hypothetical protein n=1 Tax=Citricoccus sp. NPDC055426 TaxID=3155536 RepID=UPI00341C9709
MVARRLVYSSTPEDYTPQCVSCHRLTDIDAEAWRGNCAADPAELLPGVDWSVLLVAPELARRLVPWLVAA